MKMILVKKCANCFYVRDLASLTKPTYCSIRKILLPTVGKEEILGDYIIKNVNRIPKWCPLSDVP